MILCKRETSEALPKWPCAYGDAPRDSSSPCPYTAGAWQKPPPYDCPGAVLSSCRALRTRCLHGVWTEWPGVDGAQTAVLSLSAPFKAVISVSVFWATGVQAQPTTAWRMRLVLQVWQRQKPPRSRYTSGTIFKQSKVLLLIHNISKMAVLQIRCRNK